MPRTTGSSSSSIVAGVPRSTRISFFVMRFPSTDPKRKPPGGWPPRRRLLTCGGTRWTLAPSMPRRGCPNTATNTGYARSTATNRGTTNCAPKPSITAARPCTPTLRTIQGCRLRQLRGQLVHHSPDAIDAWRLRGHAKPAARAVGRRLPGFVRRPAARGRKTVEDEPMSNVAWNWRNAAFGAVISSVAATVIAFGHIETGLGLLIGAIPAAIVGLRPRRRDRRRVLIVGILFGASQMFGSILAQWTPVAVVGMFLFGLEAALLTTRSAIGWVVLTLCLPLAGIGLTYTGLAESAGVSFLFILGSAIAFIGALCFPEHEAPSQQDPPLLGIRVARDYGVRLARRDRNRRCRRDRCDGSHQREPLVRDPGVHNVPDPVEPAPRPGDSREHQVPLQRTRP